MYLLIYLSIHPPIYLSMLFPHGESLKMRSPKSQKDYGCLSCYIMFSSEHVNVQGLSTHDARWNYISAVLEDDHTIIRREMANEKSPNGLGATAITAITHLWTMAHLTMAHLTMISHTSISSISSICMTTTLPEIGLLLPLMNDSRV